MGRAYLPDYQTRTDNRSNSSEAATFSQIYHCTKQSNIPPGPCYYFLGSHLCVHNGSNQADNLYFRTRQYLLHFPGWSPRYHAAWLAFVMRSVRDERFPALFVKCYSFRGGITRSIVKISLLPVFCDGIVRPIVKIGVLSVLVLFFSRGAPRFATTSHLRFRPLRLLDDSQQPSFSGSIPAAPVLASHSDMLVHQVVNGVPWRVQADTSRRSPTACTGIRCIQHQKSLPASSRPQTSHTENRVTPSPGAATSRCYTAGATIKRRNSRLRPFTGFACDK